MAEHMVLTYLHSIGGSFPSIQTSTIPAGVVVALNVSVRRQPDAHVPRLYTLIAYQTYETHDIKTHI